MNPKDTAWLEFRNLTFVRHDNPIRDKVLSRENKGQEPRENCTEVFLCHARLYAFAEKYDIEPLKGLTKQKMHRSLVSLVLHKERAGDIVALLRYIYANTPDRDHATDELRELVMKYVVCKYEIMASSEAFLDLMEEGGACVRECLKMLSAMIK